MKKYIFIIFLITIGCSNNKVVYNHGLNALEAKSSKIIALKSNKNDVVKQLGKPSSVSLFDENNWFYIQRVKENQSILKLGKSKIKKNNVLEVKFNDIGIVESKRLYQLNNMNNLKVVSKITTKSYSNTSTIGKMLKSLEQKVNSPKQNRSR